MTALLLALACTHHQLPTATIQVDGHAVQVEVAAKDEHRQNGLMNRDHMPADQGMLFIYADERTRSFWMKNTRIPLSIAYADKSGKIVRITDMEPFSADPVPSLYPAQFALEMNRGWFERTGVKPGARITGIPAVDIE